MRALTLGLARSGAWVAGLALLGCAQHGPPRDDPPRAQSPVERAATQAEANPLPPPGDEDVAGGAAADAAAGTPPPQQAQEPSPAATADAPAAEPTPATADAAPAAQPAEPDAKSMRPPAQGAVAPAIDKSTEMLSDALDSAASWLDGLFGEPGYISEGRTTQGRLEVGALHSEFYDTEVRLRLHARVQLPAFERRVSAFVGRENDDEYAQDRSEGFGLRSLFAPLDEPIDWFTGLGFTTPFGEYIDSDTRIGVRGVSDPQFFVQQRVVFKLYTGELSRVRLRTTPFWNTEDRTGFTSSIDWGRVLGRNVLLRWNTAGTIAERIDGVRWRSALVLYHALRKRRGIAYELFVRGLSEDVEPLREYGGLVLYRQPVLQDRLVVLLQTGYSWPRIDPELPRDGAYAVGLGFEIPL